MPRPDPRQVSLTDLFDLMVTPPTLPPAEALVAAGVTTPFLLTLGPLRDSSVPYSPRSIAFPVRFETTYGKGPRLLLSTPGCADLPFVQRVEAISGLRAEWDPRFHGGQWHHAVDLATDAGWRTLAASMVHTTVDAVERGAGLNLTWGKLSVANARALLAAVGVAEPEGGSAAEWDRISATEDGGISCQPMGAWWAIHGIEAGWMLPGKPGNETKGPKYERLTPAGWARIGQTPPAAQAKRSRKEAA